MFWKKKESKIHQSMQALVDYKRMIGFRSFFLQVCWSAHHSIRCTEEVRMEWYRMARECHRGRLVD